ncbi:MAG: hypothetical protein Q7T56_01995 [Nocardioidaceae bacterium]|nr:hypothetical protein [Nocardioidaceae bacterium]
MSGSPVTLWYAGYGSNTLDERFRAYLDGSATSSRFGAHPAHPAHLGGGATGRTAWATCDHALGFAGRSVRWDGAVAFLGLRPEAGAVSHLRLHELTASQLAHVATVENNVPDLGWDGDVGGLEVGGTHRFSLPAGLGPARGKYDTVLRLPDHEGLPVVTLTTSRDLAGGSPGEAYRQVVADGLAGSGLSRDEVAAYLDHAVARSACRPASNRCSD